MPASDPTTREVDLTDPRKQILNYQQKTEPSERGDYGDFYRRMKEMAKDKGLKDKEL